MPIAHGAAIDMVERTYADYATAAQALDILKVRPQTLYAYVSRGLVRSIPQPGQKERLYRRDDLKRLETRSLARAGHGAVAAAAMNFGEPIISTSITEITAEGPRYRGRMAADLARSHASSNRSLTCYGPASGMKASSSGRQASRGRNWPA
jgi:citrate synthase